MSVAYYSLVDPHGLTGMTASLTPAQAKVVVFALTWLSMFAQEVYDLREQHYRLVYVPLGVLVGVPASIRLPSRPRTHQM